ncbi:MAG TPA: porin family protein [Gemmatimonadaceae bacterium]|nr:porin family protein [Gemmatimonadaceae bacterium]
MNPPSTLPLPFARAALAALAAGALLSSPVLAQSREGGSSLRVGIIGGGSSTTIGGKDADDAERRTGFLAGAYLVKPFAGSLALRPELLLSQKGAKTTVVEDDVAAKVELKLTYIDIPVLLQYEPSAAAATVRPHLYAGPSFGFKSNCKLEASAGDISGSVDCDDDFDLKSFDLGGVVGGGIGFPLGGVGATVGARYQHGFSDIAKDATVKNRVFSLYASVEFGTR